MAKRLKIINLILVLTMGVTTHPHGSCIGRHNTPQSATNNIPIVITIDNNYVWPAIVSMTSMLENAKETTSYHIHVLISGDFLEENKQKLLSLKSAYKNCDISFFDMGNEFDNFQPDNGVTIDWITKVVFYRLRVPSVLSNIQKCIYLDTDTLIREDLSELYDIDVSDYYVAGVADGMRWRGHNHTRIKSYFSAIGLPDAKHYINAGILLMNLKEMRKNNLEKRFAEFVDIKVNKEKIAAYADQDAINVVCYDKILDLPIKYNVMLSCIDFITPYKKNGYAKLCQSEEEWEKGIKNPVVMHYALQNKPWKNFCPHMVDWWEHAAKTAFVKEIIKTYKSELEKNCKKFRNSRQVRALKRFFSDQKKSAKKQKNQVRYSVLLTKS
ncbi:hypothetical protein FACS189481_0270 [Clostridia bacterium]|nr:hypothetical protein FACS189481_0270 [Clostridia bacterium]